MAALPAAQKGLATRLFRQGSPVIAVLSHLLQRMTIEPRQVSPKRRPSARDFFYLGGFSSRSIFVGSFPVALTVAIALRSSSFCAARFCPSLCTLDNSALSRAFSSLICASCLFSPAT